MSLNWDVTACADHEELLAEGEWPRTEALIWTTISVGLGEITEENWMEFYARAHAVEVLYGLIENAWTKPQDVRRRIGLRTNVAKETRLQWAKRLLVSRVDDFVAMARKEAMAA